jgi:hypothetical protein
MQTSCCASFFARRAKKVAQQERIRSFLWVIFAPQGKNNLQKEESTLLPQAAIAFATS